MIPLSKNILMVPFVLYKHVSFELRDELSLMRAEEMQTKTREMSCPLVLYL